MAQHRRGGAPVEVELPAIDGEAYDDPISIAAEVLITKRYDGGL